MISGNPTALKRATCFLVRASWDKVHGLDPTMVEIRSFLPHKPFRAPKASVIQVLWVPDFIVAVLCRHWQGIGDTLHNAWYTSYFSSASWPWSWWLWFPNPNFHLLKLIDIDSDIDDQFDHMNEVKLTVNLTTKTQLVFKDHTLKKSIDIFRRLIFVFASLLLGCLHVTFSSFWFHPTGSLNRQEPPQQQCGF